MLRFVVLAAALLLATPALAEPIVLTIQNDSSHVVTRLNIFAVGKDGEPIEDNIGAIMEDVAARSTGTLELDISSCQTIYLAVMLDEKEDLSTFIDTCRGATLVVRD
jgi:hypothetical protein